jgi:hypothetical protein
LERDRIGNGMDPGRGTAQGKAGLQSKLSLFGLRSKSISSFALNARKGTPGGGGTMPTPKGPFPTMIVAASTVLVAVSITETELEVEKRGLEPELVT